MPFLDPLKIRVKRALKKRLLDGRFASRSWSLGDESAADVPVLMCLWNRPERLPDIARMLDSQVDVPGVQLFLWNNARADHQRYVDSIDALRSEGALRAVHLVRSPFNLGSIARFYWARRIATTSPTRPIVVIDDDENVRADFLASALQQYRPDAVTGWWAWTLGPQGYWDRSPAQPGDRVDHVGPGGSVMSSEIFRDARFFTRIPERFQMLDDVWLSYFAQRTGRHLAKLDVPIEFVMDETNQHHGQADIKREFFDALAAGEVPLD